MDIDDNEIVAEPLSVLPNPRARRLRSLVWNDFTKRQKPDGNYEAICNHCGKKFTANSRSGTTHLRNHLNFCLSTRRADGRKRGRKPRLASKAIGGYNDDKDGPSGFLFDQELSRQDLARMVIFHGYPFEIGHHVGFKTFIRNLQPQFKLVSDEDIKADCMNIYESRRDKLSEVLEILPCRVSLTVERWCLSNGPEYLCLNCHYLDNDWKLQRKVLSLLHFGAPPSAEDISEEIMEKLHDWKISRKLSCMVVERSGDDQGAPSNLLLKVLRGTNSLLLNGDLFQFHGCVPALDAIVQDALLQIGDLCDRVRSCVKFVKFSLEKMRRFENAAMLAEAPRVPLVVDDNSSWSSALLMISTAYETRNAFKSLAEYDSDFSFPLTDQEWDDVKSVKECLETFDHMIKKFSSIRMPTANLYFIDICGILLLLKSWAVSPVLIVAKLASQMLKGFEEYWDANVTLLAIASILDPRYKMKSVEYFFRHVYFGDFEQKVKIDGICNSLRSLYNEYAVHSACSKSDRTFLCYGNGTNGCNVVECGTTGGSHTTSHITLSDTRRGLDQYLQQTLSNQSIKSDLDLYLEEAVYIYNDVPDDGFNVLAWWKLNVAKYPILSVLARDVLPIPLATTKSRIEDRPLSQFFSSLDQVTLQAMVCAQDWLRDEMEASLDVDACIDSDKL